MGHMSQQANLRARRLRVELWVYALEDEEMPVARDVAEGMGEGLGDAWYELKNGEYAISYVWHVEYTGAVVGQFESGRAPAGQAQQLAPDS